MEVKESADTDDIIIMDSGPKALVDTALLFSM